MAAASGENEDLAEVEEAEAEAEVAGSIECPVTLTAPLPLPPPFLRVGGGEKPFPVGCSDIQVNFYNRTEKEWKRKKKEKRNRKKKIYAGGFRFF